MVDVRKSSRWRYPPSWRYPVISRISGPKPVLSQILPLWKRDLVLQKWINFFNHRRIYGNMSWWKTTVEGKTSVITIYSFHWRLFLAMMLGGILTGLLFLAFIWLKSLVS